MNVGGKVVIPTPSGPPAAGSSRRISSDPSITFRPATLYDRPATPVHPGKSGADAGESTVTTPPALDSTPGTAIATPLTTKTTVAPTNTPHRPLAPSPAAAATHPTKPRGDQADAGRDCDPTDDCPIKSTATKAQSSGWSLAVDASVQAAHTTSQPYSPSGFKANSQGRVQTRTPPPVSDIFVDCEFLPLPPLTSSPMTPRRRVFEEAPYPVQRYIDLKHDERLRPNLFRSNNDGDDDAVTQVQYLDAARFEVIQQYDSANLPREFNYASAAGCFDERFQHVGGRMGAKSSNLILCRFTMDMPQVRAREEIMYVRRLRSVLWPFLVDDPERRRTTRLDLFERLVFPGEYRHNYILNRTYWCVDFWNESRIRIASCNRHQRARSTRRRPANMQPGLVFGWHNVEYHHLLWTDRARLYFHLPDDWLDQYEASKYLAVPAPWAAHYVANLVSRFPANEPLQRAITDIFMAEWVQNFALTHVAAAFEGLPFVQEVDQRHGPDYPGERRRLFRIPRRVVEMLGEIHPFFFLQTSGLDPVRGFLALRRAQEYSWAPSVDCAGYDFATGEVLPLTETAAIYRGQAHNVDAVIPNCRVRNPTTLEQCEEAFQRFRSVTSGHTMMTRRAQPCLEATQVMNEEGFGIESAEVEAIRLRNARTNLDRWELLKAPHSQVARALATHAAHVSGLHVQSHDGGFFHQPETTHDCLPRHPPNTVDNPEPDTDDDDDYGEEEQPPPQEEPSTFQPPPIDVSSPAGPGATMNMFFDTAALEAEKANLETLLANAIRQADEATAAKDAAEAVKSELEEARDGALAQTAALTEERDAAVSARESADSAKRDVETALSSARDNLAISEQALASLREEKETVDNDLLLARGARSEAEQNFESAESRRIEVVLALDELRSAHEALETEKSDADSRATSAQAARVAAEAALSDARAAASSSATDATVAALRAQVQTLTTQRDAARGALQAAEGALDSSAVGSDGEVVSALHSRISRLTESLGAANLGRSNALVAQTNAESELVQARLAFQTFRADVTSLISRLSSTLVTRAQQTFSQALDDVHAAASAAGIAEADQTTQPGQKRPRSAPGEGPSGAS